MDIAAVREIAELAETKPLGVVCLECRYPIVTLALKEILKEHADVYEQKEQPPGVEQPSCIILCSDGRGVASEVRRLGTSNPQAAILVFWMGGYSGLVQKALKAGARGFLHAGMRPEQIVRNVRLAREGKTVMTGELLESPFLEEQGEPAVADLRALTSRQRQILGLVSEGLSNAQIAERLFLTESTVKQHLRASYKLLRVRNRVQAAKLLS